MRRIVAMLGLATLLIAGSAHAAANLTKKQRNMADQLISLFENSTPEIQYCYIENIGDGRGFTAGRAGFTTATSDLLEVVERYTRAVPGNPLARFLPRLREVAREESGSTAGLEGLPDAWRQACQDARQRAAQDSLVDDWYFRPALRKARRVGLKLPLSIAQVYDAEIQHGGGTDPDGTPAMIRRTNKRAGGTPKRRKVSEKKWLKTFLKVRRATLRNATDPDTRDAWRESVGRVDAFSYLVRTGQWRLRAPVKLDTRVYPDTTLR
jgi:chitosanase